MDLLIANGTVVTMNPRREVLFGTDVCVQHGRISRIGRSGKKRLGPHRILDASGLIVMPGLVHGHLHACQTLFRNQADGLELLDWLRARIWPLEAAHDEISLRASADLTFAELIRSGSTAALDMGTVRYTDVIFESARECGFRLTGGKAMMDLGDDVPPALRESTADSISESVRLIQTWHGAARGRIRYAFAPRFVLSSTVELLRAVAQKARQHQVRIHSHASESRSECESVRQRTGMDNVAYFHSLGLTGDDVTLAHCVWLSDEERAILARTGTCVCHCPSANCKLASGIAPVPELLAEGVNLCLGADGAACNNNLDMFAEMRLSALIHAPRAGAGVLPPERVLEMATLGGARALGLGAEIGSIEPGKRADLAILHLSGAHAIPASDVVSQIVYSAKASDVVHVVVDGQILMQQRELLTLDEKAVLSTALKQSRLVLARANLANSPARGSNRST